MKKKTAKPVSKGKAQNKYRKAKISIRDVASRIGKNTKLGAKSRLVKIVDGFQTSICKFQESMERVQVRIGKVKQALEK